jgi:hypothetical protein
MPYLTVATTTERKEKGRSGLRRNALICSNLRLLLTGDYSFGFCWAPTAVTAGAKDETPTLLSAERGASGS